MQKVTCFPCSSFGNVPTVWDNFDMHEESVSITWDDGMNFNDPSWFRVMHQCEPRCVVDIIDRLVANHLLHMSMVPNLTEQVASTGIH